MQKPLETDAPTSVPNVSRSLGPTCLYNLVKHKSFVLHHTARSRSVPKGSAKGHERNSVQQTDKNPASRKRKGNKFQTRPKPTCTWRRGWSGRRRARSDARGWRTGHSRWRGNQPGWRRGGAGCNPGGRRSCRDCGWGRQLGLVLEVEVQLHKRADISI